MRALLIGDAPGYPLGYEYVKEAPYEAVVIGSLSLSQQLCFGEQSVLEALGCGMPVVLYAPGLQDAPGNRALAATLAGKRRELKNWGVVFTDGGRKRLITAQEAKFLRQSGQKPGRDAVMTPLAREILEGSD